VELLEIQLRVQCTGTKKKVGFFFSSRKIKKVIKDLRQSRGLNHSILTFQLPSKAGKMTCLRYEIAKACPQLYTAVDVRVLIIIIRWLLEKQR
jgi:hypothetical protein